MNYWVLLVYQCIGFSFFLCRDISIGYHPIFLHWLQFRRDIHVKKGSPKVILSIWLWLVKFFCSIMLVRPHNLLYQWSILLHCLSLTTLNSELWFPNMWSNTCQIPFYVGRNGQNILFQLLIPTRFNGFCLSHIFRHICILNPFFHLLKKKLYLIFYLYKFLFQFSFLFYSPLSWKMCFAHAIYIITGEF